MRIQRNYLVVAMALVGCGCASGSGGITQSPLNPPAIGEAAVTPVALQKTRVTRILVNADCTATIDDYVLVGKPGKKIGWLVEDAGCSSGETWRIELQFENNWNNGRDRIVKIDKDDLKELMVHPDTPVTKPGEGHTYKVYLVYPRSGDDLRIPVIDPEVDIAM